jgi:hypothetical protein
MTRTTNPTKDRNEPTCALDSFFVSRSYTKAMSAPRSIFQCEIGADTRPAWASPKHPFSCPVSPVPRDPCLGLVEGAG